VQIYAKQQTKQKQSQLTKPKQPPLLLANGIVCMLSALTQSKRREAKRKSSSATRWPRAEHKIKRHDQNIYHEKSKKYENDG